METKINDWREQFEYFGLDYSTCVARIRDYKFDIRFDCDHANPKSEPTNCGLVLTISYHGNIICTQFGPSILVLKKYAERWFMNEVTIYYNSYCVLFKEFE